MATAPTGARNSTAMGIRTGATAKRSIMVTNGPAESSRTLNPASRIAAHQPIDVATLPSGQWNVARHRRGFYRRLSHDGKLSQGRSGVVSTATEFLESPSGRNSEKELGSG